MIFFLYLWMDDIDYLKVFFFIIVIKYTNNDVEEKIILR